MGYHRGTVLAKDEYFPMWSGAAWRYYRYSRSRVAHLFSVIPLSMDYAKSFCGQIVSIPLLEREESAKTLCKVCLRNNRKHEIDELEQARRERDEWKREYSLINAGQLMAEEQVKKVEAELADARRRLAPLEGECNIDDGIKLSIGIDLTPSSKGIATEYSLSYPLEPKPDPAQKQKVTLKRVINPDQTALEFIGKEIREGRMSVECNGERIGNVQENG